MVTAVIVVDGGIPGRLEWAKRQRCSAKAIWRHLSPLLEFFSLTNDYSCVNLGNCPVRGMFFEN
jgi:hypothetical protein